MTQGDDLGLHSGASPKAKKEGIQKHQYKVKHSGKKTTRLGRNSNNSNADVIFRKDNPHSLKSRLCSDCSRLVLPPVPQLHLLFAGAAVNLPSLLTVARYTHLKIAVCSHCSYGRSQPAANCSCRDFQNEKTCELDCRRGHSRDTANTPVLSSTKNVSPGRAAKNNSMVHVIDEASRLPIFPTLGKNHFQIAPVDEG